VSATDLLLATLAMAAGSLVQGAAGFGMALVAAPLLVLIDPRLVPGPLTCASLTLTLLMSYRDRQSIHVAGLGWTFLGRLPGSAVGALALAALPAREMGIGIGALILLAAATVASGVHVRPTRGTLLGAGLASGFMGTTTSIGGPPLALVFSSSAGGHLRGNLAGNFVLGGLVSLVALASVGRFGPEEALLGLGLIPGLGFGYLASLRVAGWLDRGWLRPAVLTVAAAGGLAVIARQMI
jgi:uncharacterized protein